jgi:hypothetical protein
MSKKHELESRQSQALQKVAETHPAEKLLVMTLLESAEYLRDTGRYDLARDIVDRALLVALRWHYCTFAGKGGMANIDAHKAINALRASRVISKGAYLKLVGFITQPNDRSGLYNLLQAVRLLAGAMIQPIEDNGRPLSLEEANRIYRGCTNADWHFGVSRASRVESKPQGLTLLRKAAI